MSPGNYQQPILECDLNLITRQKMSHIMNQQDNFF